MGLEIQAITQGISARNLTKKFGDFTAVDGIDFEVKPAETFGFLGPNGAGKTSTMKMIGCVSPISGGEMRVLGLDPQTQSSQIKARLGVVPQIDNLDNEITVVENLTVYARYFNISRAVARDRAAELLEFVQLSDKVNSQVQTLSGGMRRRLTIARALMNDPSLLLLDEPTTGLDPQARHLLWDRLYRLKARGVGIVLTTHYMDEAEQLCDRLVVMDKARIVAEGTPRELIAKYVTPEVVELRITEQQRSELHTKLKELSSRIETLPDRTVVYTEDADALMHSLTGGAVHPDSALVRRATLEDVFLTLTGRSLIE